jgi:hypothetical protein
MAASRKKAICIALDPDVDQLLTRAARECGISRAEFVRRRLMPVLEQYRPHPKSRSAQNVRSDAPASNGWSVYDLTSDLAGSVDASRKAATNARRRFSKL